VGDGIYILIPLVPSPMSVVEHYSKHYSVEIHM
jgi:hypothetical protein